MTRFLTIQHWPMYVLIQYVHITHTKNKPSTIRLRTGSDFLTFVSLPSSAGIFNSLISKFKHEDLGTGNCPKTALYTCPKKNMPRNAYVARGSVNPRFADTAKGLLVRSFDKIEVQACMHAYICIAHT